MDVQFPIPVRVGGLVFIVPIAIAIAARLFGPKKPPSTSTPQENQKWLRARKFLSALGRSLAWALLFMFALTLAAMFAVGPEGEMMERAMVPIGCIFYASWIVATILRYRTSCKRTGSIAGPTHSDEQ